MNVLLSRQQRNPVALLVATLMAGVSGVVLAQENELDTMVVTASGFEQQIKEAPASISVITRKDFENKSFRDLTDVLSSVEGVVVTGTSTEQDIFIRGLPGAYTLILVDGRRQSTRETRTNGNSGFEQSFIPPMEAIERIEVIRGPMSTLYGSDAMGGVINIITRKIPKVWGGSVNTDVTLQGHDNGGSHQEQFFIGGPIKSDVVGLQLWGRAYNRSEDKLVGGKADAKDHSLKARLAITPNANHEFMVEAGTENLERRANEYKTIAKSGSSKPTYNENRRDSMALSHKGRWGWANSELSLSQEVAKRENYTFDTASKVFTQNKRSPEVTNSVLDGKLIAPLGNHLLTLGMQVVHAKLEDTNPGLRDDTLRSFSSTQKSLFVEDEWSITEQLKLTGGLRADDSAYGLNWSPRLYAVWNASEDLTVKGGIARGYKTPDIRQSSAGYAYTTGGGNCSYGPRGTCGVALGDPNLKPETSTSFELGALWEATEKLSLGATYFNTDFRNKLINEKKLDANGNEMRWAEDPNYLLFEHRNVERAKIQGVEMSANWQAAPSLQVKSSYTYTQSKQRGGDYDGRPLARTPEHQASIRMDWSATERMKLWSAYTFHGKEVNAGLRIGTAGKVVGTGAREYDSYQLLDLGVSFKLNKKTTLNAALYNVTDKRLTTEAHNTIGEGRRVWLGMNVNF